MNIYAYARVSAQDQNIARQLDAFQEFGVSEKFIYVDKRSGKDFERENYKKLLRRLRKGDTLVIKSIDRLGRNYSAILREWSRITGEIEADIVVLDMPLLDTRTTPDNLVGKFISDLVLQILSFVAENERADIRKRQREGIDSARSRGVKFGRPGKTYSEDFVSICRAYFEGAIPLKDALTRLGVKRCNFYYHAHRLEELGYLPLGSVAK